jgi:hypothetical protein
MHDLPSTYYRGMHSILLNFYWSDTKTLGEKPVEVGEGRQEIYDCWVEGIKARPKVDKIALMDAVCGASQLGFNSIQSSLITAYVSRR